MPTKLRGRASALSLSGARRPVHTPAGGYQKAQACGQFADAEPTAQHRAINTKASLPAFFEVHLEK
jgi:hypothetical protein